MFVENGVRYYILFNCWGEKSFSIFLSSCKKRRELRVFEEKESISFNGIEVLIKILNIVNIEFPKFYNSDLTLVVFWADNKRRRVYKRLENSVLLNERRIQYYRIYDFCKSPFSICKRCNPFKQGFSAILIVINKIDINS